MCSVDLIKIGSETPMRRGLELRRRDQKEKKKAGKKQTVLSSSSLLQWEAVSQKPEQQSRCVPSKENKPQRERGRRRLDRPEQLC